MTDETKNHILQQMLKSDTEFTVKHFAEAVEKISYFFEIKNKLPQFITVNNTLLSCK